MPSAGKRLRVLLVDPGGELGGAEVVLDAVVSAVDRTRVDPVVACLLDGSWPRELRARGTEVHVFDRPRLRHVFRVAQVVASLTRIVRHDRIGVVHANGNSALLYASLAARIGGARLLWHLHDPQSAIGARRRLLLWVLRLLRPDHLIFSSPAPASSWLEALGTRRPQSSMVIPDVDRVGIERGDAARARTELGLPEDSPIVAMLARPEVHKGHEDLLRAVAILQQSIPRIRVVMTTGWAEAAAFRSRLHEIADELGIGGVICLPAAVDPSLKADLLAASTVLAHPSWVEPFGLAMLEAMTAGRPVVAAETDGSRYLVEPGVTGLLVPPHDPVRLAAALAELLEDPERARRMGAAGGERARQISDGRMVERIVEIWEASPVK